MFTVVAVTSRVLVKNRNKFLARIQSIEYKIIAFTSVIKAHIDYYRHKKALRKKREDIQQYRITYPDKLILNKSLVYGFFIRKKETYSELMKD